jgi:hypothetical protein
MNISKIAAIVGIITGSLGIISGALYIYAWLRLGLYLEGFHTIAHELLVIGILVSILAKQHEEKESGGE